MPLRFFSPRGYYVEFGDPPGSEPFVHAFCGEHRIPGAVCETCRKPLLRFLSLDPRDPRLGLDAMRVKVLPLVFCWTCDKSSSLTYRVTSEGNVEVLDPVRGTVEAADFPYENYPRCFPGKAIRLVPVPEEDQALIRRANRDELNDEIVIEGKYVALATPRHQVGGEPYLVQGFNRDLEILCSLCKEAIPILAAIGDQSGSEQGFVDNEFVQVLFHYCVPCGVVKAYNECD